MLYAKNVPAFERLIRIVMGVAVAAAGLYLFKGGLLGYVMIGGGAMIALTGFVGFCPMCAMAGRKLAKRLPKD